MEMYLDDAPNYISINQNGAIQYETIFYKNFKGDWLELMRCIEDNIFNDDTIDWPQVFEDYKEFSRKKGNVLGLALGMNTGFRALPSKKANALRKRTTKTV